MAGMGPDFHQYFLQQLGLAGTEAFRPRTEQRSFAPDAGASLAWASRWLTYCNTQAAENMRLSMALGSCRSGTDAVELWATYFKNSQQHLADASAVAASHTSSSAATSKMRPDSASGPQFSTQPAPKYETEAKPAAPAKPTAPVKPAAQAKPSTGLPETAAESVAKPATDTATPPAKTSPEGTAPARLKAPRSGQADDLKRISGVGPLLEQKLNELGIYHFDQLAELTPDNIRWVDGKLRFRGRIERERWIEQAKLLAGGGEPTTANGAVGHSASASD